MDRVFRKRLGMKRVAIKPRVFQSLDILESQYHEVRGAVQLVGDGGDHRFDLDA
jgi:hypothetical protein